MLVLVTGATGSQGGAVARALLQRGHRVRAFTRRPAAPDVARLRELGAEIAAGSFEDRASIERAARGVDAMFAVGTPFEAGVDAEVRQGCAVAEAAKAAGVPHVVYTSVAGADRQTGVPHFDSKHAIERHLGSLGAPSTILGPVYFMENALSPPTIDGLRRGVLAMPLPPERPLQQIALDDIGRFGALVIERRAEFLGRRIEIASDEPSGIEAAAAISRVTRREVRYASVPLKEVAARSDDLARMFRWLTSTGHNVDVAALRRDYPEVGWHRFEDWALEHAGALAGR